MSRSFMQVKADNPVALEPGQARDAVSGVIRLALEAAHLKHLYRQGWLRRGVPESRCESVADHVFSVALLAMFLADQFFPELDTGRVMRTALIHDLGEVEVGDITPGDGVPLEEKRGLERAALTRLFADLPDGDRYLELWEAFEAQTTPEARFVREVDRLEMALQAGIYAGQLGIDGEEFFASARQVVAGGRLDTFLERIAGIGRRVDSQAEGENPAGRP